MTLTRAMLAAHNAVAARAQLHDCRLCAHRCGVDRTAGPAGVCHAGGEARVFYQGIEWAGESACVPTAVVSFAGCNLGCLFCLTGGPSQDARSGAAFDPQAVSDRIAASGAALKSVTILGGEPTIHLPAALELIARLPPSLPVVWKTNAYASPEALALLEGAVDLVLADFKFGNDVCAQKLAGAPHYLETVNANLAWAARRSRLIVRRLIMPGHRDCCLLPVLDILASTQPTTMLSLMGGYLPAYRAAEAPQLGRLNRPDEVEQARAAARSRGLVLAPWTVATSRTATPPHADELWLDRHGRVLVDSASAPLIDCLERLGLELTHSQPEGRP